MNCASGGRNVIYCIDDNTVVELVEGKLSSERLALLEEHTAICGSCRLRLAVASASPSLVGGAPANPAGLPEAPQGYPESVDGTSRSVDRFEVRHVLGSGGMGIVFAAYDPELQRNVALKLLRGIAVTTESTAEAQARLIAEARTMARLSHSNIVTVYESGTFRGEPYIVMELIHGVTLTSWLRRWARPWRSILEAFVQAGRALAHAHLNELAHGDFKPDNVLVDDSDRVRVMDFGLARSFSPADILGMTGERMLMGTPRFMAPEQYRGEPPSALSDQFSFSVALYEALYGQHPFAHDTPASLIKLPAQEAIRAVPEREVPMWLRDAILKGLSVDPANRHRSMSELLLALTPPAPRPPRRTITAVVVAALMGVCALGYAMGAQHGASSTPGTRDEHHRVDRSGKGDRPAKTSPQTPDGPEPEPVLEPRPDDGRIRLEGLERMLAPDAGYRDSGRRYQIIYDLVKKEMRDVHTVVTVLSVLVDGNDPALARVNRRVADVDRRLEGLEGQVARMTTSHIHRSTGASPPGKPSSTNGLSSQVLAASIADTHWRDLEVCFLEWRDRHPDEGDQALDSILYVSELSKASIRRASGLADKVVRKCVAGALEAVQFPPARIPSEVKVALRSHGLQLRMSLVVR